MADSAASEFARRYDESGQEVEASFHAVQEKLADPAFYRTKWDVAPLETKTVFDRKYATVKYQAEYSLARNVLFFPFEMFKLFFHMITDFFTGRGFIHFLQVAERTINSPIQSVLNVFDGIRTRIIAPSIRNVLASIGIREVSLEVKPEGQTLINDTLAYSYRNVVPKIVKSSVLPWIVPYFGWQFFIGFFANRELTEAEAYQVAKYNDYLTKHTFAGGLSGFVPYRVFKAYLDRVVGRKQPDRKVIIEENPDPDA